MVQRRRPDVEVFDVTPRHLLLQSEVENRPAGDLVERAKGYVVGHAHARDQTGRTVLSHVSEAYGDGVGRGVDPRFFAEELERAVRRGLKPEQGAGQSSPTRAHQAENCDDLPCTQLEVGGLESRQSGDAAGA